MEDISPEIQPSCGACRRAMSAAPVQVTYDKNANTTVTGARQVRTCEIRRLTTAASIDAEKVAEARVRLLGQTVINHQFGKQNPVDKINKIDHIGFLVIGVLPIKGATGFRDQDENLMPPRP